MTFHMNYDYYVDDEEYTLDISIDIQPVDKEVGINYPYVEEIYINNIYIDDNKLNDSDFDRISDIVLKDKYLPFDLLEDIRVNEKEEREYWEERKSEELREEQLIRERV